MIVPALYLLDTNITGYIVRNQSPVARTVFKETLLHSRVAISTITEAEILFGLERRPEARQLRVAAEQFLALLEVLPWDSAAARAYARLRNALRNTGVTLSDADEFIAAHAIATSATLVSHDGAFQHVRPYLSVVDWATDIKPVQTK